MGAFPPCAAFSYARGVIFPLSSWDACSSDSSKFNVQLEFNALCLFLKHPVLSLVHLSPPDDSVWDLFFSYHLIFSYLGALASWLLRFRCRNAANRSFQGGPLIRRRHSCRLCQKLHHQRFPECAVRRFERPARRFKAPCASIQSPPFIPTLHGASQSVEGSASIQSPPFIPTLRASQSVEGSASIQSPPFIPSPC